MSEELQPNSQVDGQSPDATRSWSATRRATIAVAALAIAVLSFLAGTGWKFGVITDWLDDPERTTRVEGDWAAGEVVASDTDAGVVASVEIAPSVDGRERCVRVRVGAREFGARCSAEPLVPWDDPDFRIVRLADYFGFFDEHAVRTDSGWVVALSGAVHPDVIRVTAHLGDGGQYSFVTRNPGGWFVVMLPDDVADPDVDDGHLVNSPVLLEFFARRGDPSRLGRPHLVRGRRLTGSVGQYGGVDPPQLLVIRHGQTEWSRTGKHTGRTDIPLTEQGRDEARDAARTLDGWHLTTRAYRSPLRRARETAEIVARRRAVSRSTTRRWSGITATSKARPRRRADSGSRGGRCGPTRSPVARPSTRWGSEPTSSSPGSTTRCRSATASCSPTDTCSPS